MGSRTHLSGTNKGGRPNRRLKKLLNRFDQAGDYSPIKTCEATEYSCKTCKATEYLLFQAPERSRYPTIMDLDPIYRGPWDHKNNKVSGSSGKTLALDLALQIRLRGGDALHIAELRLREAP